MQCLYQDIAFSVRYYSHKLEAIPRAQGLPLIGTIFDLIMSGGGPKLHLYIDKRHKQLGPIFYETLGPVSAVFISDPSDMRKVFSAEGKYPNHLLPEAWVLYNKLHDKERGLFFMHGEEWLKYRQIMNKLLLRKELTDGSMNSYKVATHDLLYQWTKSINKPIENAVSDMYMLSISYVVATLIGSSYPEHRTQLRPAVENLSSVAYRIFEESTKLSLLPAKIAMTLKLPVWRRFVCSVNTALDSAETLVNQLFPLAAGDGVLTQMKNEGIAQKKIANIVVDLVLAAADTTPYSLIWALYLLALNPDVQSKIAEQLEENPDKWVNNPMVRAVSKETLRLYPAAPFLTRELVSDCELSGFNIPSKTLIIMSLYTSGRNEAYFPQPERFWPERWMRVGDTINLMGVREKSASLPFAMGARACIGRKVAITEMSLTLAEILSCFKVHVDKKVEMVLMLVPVPSDPITFKLTARKK